LCFILAIIQTFSTTFSLRCVPGLKLVICSWGKAVFLYRSGFLTHPTRTRYSRTTSRRSPRKKDTNERRIRWTTYSNNSNSSNDVIMIIIMLCITSNRDVHRRLDGLMLNDVLLCSAAVHIISSQGHALGGTRYTPWSCWQ
jgi:hypothetical protein